MTERQLLRQIGANVKAARGGANLTQECLAEIAGIHWQTVSYVENGRYLSSVVTFYKISQALGVSPNRLLDGLPPLNAARAERIKKAMARKRAAKK